MTHRNLFEKAHVLSIPARLGWALVLLVLLTGLGLVGDRRTRAEIDPRPLRVSSSDDAYADLVVGVSGEDLTETDAGAVHVFYTDGTNDFPVDDTSAMDWWYQGYAGLNGLQEQEDRFGSALAIGDFNGDHLTDLAVGVPYETINLLEGGTALYAGAVHIIYASATGLTSSGDAIFDMDDYYIDQDAQVRDFFGQELATGDFNADGYADLAIGVPMRDVGAEVDAGMVQVLFGSASGISTREREQSWFQNVLDSDIGAGDNFGYALAVGDFDGDGYDDLAASAPFEDWYTLDDVGSVHILFGDSGGLTNTESQIFYQSEIFGIYEEGDAEAGDMFGYALASGDFNADGYDDLAVGAPGEDMSTEDSAGVAHAIYGSASGLDQGTRDDAIISLHPNHYCSFDLYQEQDLFGRSLAVGDFDGDGDDDLAVGAPYDDVDSVEDAGSAYIFYSMLGSFCVFEDFGYTLNQNSPAIQGGAEADDHYGAVLTAGDIDGDGYDDLVVGIPDEDITDGGTTYYEAGGVNVIYGQWAQFDSDSPVDRFLHQGKGDIWQLSPLEGDDRFGAAVALLHPPTYYVYLPLVLR